MSQNKKIKSQFYLPYWLSKKVEEYAKERNLTKSVLLQLILEDFFKTVEKI